MALLEDLATANRDFIRNALPNLPCRVRLEATPSPRIVIEYTGDLEAPGALGYPRFVQLSGVLRPTDEYRRRLGLPPREEQP